MDNKPKTSSANVIPLSGGCVILGKAPAGKSQEEFIAEEVARLKKFEADFWKEKIAMRTWPKAARIKGQHYIIGQELTPAQKKVAMFNSGGSTFFIRFRDGRTVRTTNLSCQGEIPEGYRGVLSDNADFITEEEATQKTFQGLKIAAFVLITPLLLGYFPFWAFLGLLFDKTLPEFKKDMREISNSFFWNKPWLNSRA